MNLEEEEFSPFGGFSSGCDLHGEDFLRECTMCGIEFCSACFPQSALCPDCAAQGELDDDEEEAETPAEEKELLLLDGLVDDESEATGDESPAPTPLKAALPKKAPAKPAPNSKPSASKPATPISRAKAKAKPAPKKAIAKPAPKSKAKAKKSAKPAPKKAKAKPKTKKKR